MATAAGVISIAKKEVGYRETGTNHTKYADQVASLEWAQNQPWCSTFISWLFQKAGARDIAPVTASCEVGAAWFKAHGHLSQTPTVGSIVYYGPRGGTHVELVIQVTNDQIKTIGGNTSGSMDGNYANGDSVAEKWVDRNADRIYGYGHPVYDVANSKPMIRRGSKGTVVKEWQKILNKHDDYALKIDGEFGPKTEFYTKEFQRDAGVEMDGIVGPITWGKAD